MKHLTYCEEIQFNKFKVLRENLKGALQKQHGLKLSYMPLLIKATSLALVKFPMLNATVNSDVTEMIYHGQHNIGVAMDTPKGLIVPVIKGVQNKSIVDIAIELNQLQVLLLLISCTSHSFRFNRMLLRKVRLLKHNFLVELSPCPTLVVLVAPMLFLF